MSESVHHALYEGTIRHRRLVEPRHEFELRTLLPLLDLDRLDDAWRVHPLASHRRFRPIRVRRTDHLPGPAPLADAVRDLVGQRLGERPDGRVRMLAQFRMWGWSFNPLTAYWCDDGTGQTVAQVIEVTNTPWHERHAYVLDTRNAPGTGWDITVDKELHVSPFLPMDLRHRIRSGPPGASLSIVVDDLDPDDELAFSASIALRRRPFDTAGLTRLLVRHPVAAHRISAGIYSHALRLRARGARFHRHPRKATR
ncbi:MAG: DUF1365 domain-containing protein [Acidimicrobiales bacterium]|nr:DUF1365 domain-containing protein [Acidimicrobiales bacterium]